MASVTLYDLIDRVPEAATRLTVLCGAVVCRGPFPDVSCSPNLFVLDLFNLDDMHSEDPRTPLPPWLKFDM